MTRTVLENAELLEAIAGADGIDDRQGAGCPLISPAYSSMVKKSSNADLKGVRIGILKEAWEVNLLEPSMAGKIRAAALMFESLGAIVEDVSIPFHVHGPLLCQTIARGGGTLNKLGQQVGRRGLYLNDLAAKISPMTPEISEKVCF
jgi:amidase